MTRFKKLAAVATVAVVMSIPAVAQQATPPYGTPISLEQAKKVISAAEAEAHHVVPSNNADKPRTA